MTFFGKIFSWIGKLFKNAKKEWLQVAVKVTQQFQVAINSPIVDILTAIIPSDADDAVVRILRKELPLILAKELAIVSLTEATTEADVKNAMDKIVLYFGKLSDEEKAQLYTSMSAKIYIVLQKVLEGKKVTFGEAASLAESAYQTWIKNK